MRRGGLQLGDMVGDDREHWLMRVGRPDVLGEMVAEPHFWSLLPLLAIPGRRRSAWDCGMVVC